MIRLQISGHTAEGDWVPVTDGTATSVRFDGVLICGPHDTAGNHIGSAGSDQQTGEKS